MPKLMNVYHRGICILVASALSFWIFAEIGPVPSASGAPVPVAHQRVPLPPGPASVGLAGDTVPASNSIVELISAPPGVWAATGHGVSRYSLADSSWLTFTSSNGISNHEIPALQVFGDQIWASTSHLTVIQEQSVQWGDGLFMSADGGQTWVEASPDSDQASGPFMLAFDLASFRGAVLAACFAGGLVMTTDQGQTWKNIFPSSYARYDFVNKLFEDLNNRFFSVIVDTAVAESIAVIAGSAAGINKFVYLDRSLKITGFDFRKVLLDGSSLYAATEQGLSHSPNRGGSWRTFYQTDGLSTNLIGTMAAHGDTILVGADSVADSVGAGLAISVDSAASWQVTQPPQTVGAGRRAMSIVSAAGAWWVACGNGGLIRSADKGVTWNNVFPDSLLALDFLTNDPPAPRNRVNALMAVTTSDTTMLYAGTDDGIIAYEVPKGATPVTAGFLTVGGSEDSLGRRIVGLGYQKTSASSILWSLNRPAQSGDGTHQGYAVSADGGTTWQVSEHALTANEVAFFGSYFYLASDSGLASGVYPQIDTIAFFKNLNSFRTSPPVRSVALQFTPNFVGLDSIAAVWAATDSGLVYTKNGGTSWAVVWSNPDPYEFDLNYPSVFEAVDTATNTLPALSGNFVTALGFQQYAGRRIYWAGTQTTATGQRAGISRSEDGGSNWTVPVPPCVDTCGQVNVWNFAFDGPHVWVATSQGLLHSPNAGATWENLKQFVDPSSGARIDSTTPLYAVRVIEDQVWIGTANGLAVIDKADHHVISIRRTFVPIAGDLPSGRGGTYATPVPFSPRFFDGVRLHFKPPVPGKVKITIYDFANNVVKTFTDNIVRQEDVQYDEAVVWDGRNGRGDPVATGSYFFVVEYANGQTHWGKIAVIP
jgi:hypothetical protein